MVYPPDTKRRSKHYFLGEGPYVVVFKQGNDYTVEVEGIPGRVSLPIPGRAPSMAGPTIDSSVCRGPGCLSGSASTDGARCDASPPAPLRPVIWVRRPRGS